MARKREDPAVRFARFVEPGPNGCVLWTGRKTGNGYGHFTFAGKKVGMAHRWAYEQAVGPIPAGYQIDHLCRVRHCVNPEHLEAVTPRENTMRSNAPSARFARATACLRGHPLTQRRDGSGRYCPTCRKAASARHTERRRAARLAARGPDELCKRGHNWTETPPRVIHRSNGTVQRRCRICAREADRRCRQERAA